MSGGVENRVCVWGEGGGGGRVSTVGGLVKYPNILSEISAQNFFFVSFCVLIFLAASSSIVIPLQVLSVTIYTLGWFESVLVKSWQILKNALRMQIVRSCALNMCTSYTRKLHSDRQFMERSCPIGNCSFAYNFLAPLLIHLWELLNLYAPIKTGINIRLLFCSTRFPAIFCAINREKEAWKNL